MEANGKISPAIHVSLRPLDVASQTLGLGDMAART